MNITEKKTIIIKSNGTPSGTKVIDKETGVEIPNIKSIDFHIDVSSFGTATIKFVCPELYLELERKENDEQNA